MSRCPRCDLMMTPLEAGDHQVEGCGECGGVWVTAQALAGLAKDTPAILGSLDRQFNPSATHLPSVGRTPVCAGCGEPLVTRAFPVAPNLPLLACGKCRRIFLQDGQCQQLMAVVAPQLAAPAWEQEDEEEEKAYGRQPVGGLHVPEHREPSHRGHGPLGLWPERMSGQPWGSWFVCGMPVWVALLVQVGAGLLLMVALSADPILKLVAFLGVPLALLFWVVRTLMLALALQITWQLTDDNPGLSFGETIVLMLKVVPVVQVLTVLARLFAMFVLPWPMVHTTLTLLATLLVYRNVIELELRDIYILTIVSQALEFVAFGALGAALMSPG